MMEEAAGLFLRSERALSKNFQLQAIDNAIPLALAMATVTPQRLQLANSSHEPSLLAKMLLLAAFALLALCLLFPALRPVHAEGFSASIVSLGHHIATATLGDFAPAQPFNTEYFGLSKIGAVLGVAALSKIGFAGDSGMTLMMWIGLALTLWASAVLMRRWTQASWMAVGGVLLFMPGVLESAYFFNDNIPGTGILLLGLVVLGERSSFSRQVAAGILIGIAGSVRTDLVLFSVAVPLMLLEQGSLRQALVGTIVAGIAALLTIFAIFGIVGATPLQAVQAGKIAIELWARQPTPMRDLAIFSFFLGLPLLALLIVGILDLAKQKRWLHFTLLFGIPALIDLLFLGRMWEVRQFLPQAPFLGALALYGWLEIAPQLKARSPILLGTSAALILLAWFIPIGSPRYSDGPRLLTGRLVGLTDWLRWQKLVHDDFRLIDNLIDRVSSGERLVVLADGWNEERYLHLELQKKGFARQPMPICDKVGLRWSKGGATVVAINLEQSFLNPAYAYHAERIKSLAVPCWQETSTNQAVLVSRWSALVSALGFSPKPYDPRLETIPFSAIDVTLDDVEKINRFLDQQPYRKTHEEMLVGIQQTESRVGWIR